MDSKVRETADALMQRALEETGVPDPRAGYRSLLRQLKERDPDGYDEAVASFRDSVLPSIAEERTTPLEAWLAFGLYVAERLHPGRAVLIDETGKAAPLEGPPSWKDLVLYMPE